MNEIIHDLRLTFLWTETLPELLAGAAAPEGSSMPFLWSQQAYIDRFATILQGGLDPLGLQAPWPRPVGDFFWTYYLEGKIPGRIPAETAWRFLVPLRGRVPAQVEAPWLQNARFSLESFFFPHGLALAVSVRIQATVSPEQAMTSALQLRRDEKLEIDWTGGGHEALNLDGFSRKALQALRRAVLGSDVEVPVQGVPFSIATIVRAEGGDAEAPFPEGGMLHKLLQGLTTWAPTWKTDALKPVVEASLRTRNSPPSHALYASQRGRGIWFPGHYTPAMAQRRSLSCYHRNFVFLSLQVESLAGLVAFAAGQLGQGVLLAPQQAACARRAVGLLGRLYGGVKTYRSRSPKLQMDQNGYLAPINAVRDYFAMPPLQVQAPEGAAG